ncbi:carboxymuconolactone decarboxylase family protein [Halomicroarcula sp. GCM10025817]|uniref:carboxymuconolactone decarboxylase family protein n=1 Tax=Haloarcula TaxID=2237 RepID=UPI0023E83D90|nr:carboxymuconolactone decarboxylase family protein [Halomicroarcula sp. SYNS111]
MATTESATDVREDMEETFGMVPSPLDSIPEGDVASEWPFFKKYTVGESEIPPKYRELMGLAVAANIKCPYCLHFHRTAAELHGATEAELEEVVSLASLTSRYSAMLHASGKDIAEFEADLAKIVDHLEAQGGD